MRAVRLENLERAVRRYEELEEHEKVRVGVLLRRWADGREARKRVQRDAQMLSQGGEHGYWSKAILSYTEALAERLGTNGLHEEQRDEPWTLDALPAQMRAHLGPAPPFSKLEGSQGSSTLNMDADIDMNVEMDFLARLSDSSPSSPSPSSSASRTAISDFMASELDRSAFSTGAGASLSSFSHDAFELENDNDRHEFSPPEAWHLIFAENTSPALAVAARIDALRQNFERYAPPTVSTVNTISAVAVPNTDTPGDTASGGIAIAPETRVQAKMTDVERRVYDALMMGEPNPTGTLISGIDESAMSATSAGRLVADADIYDARAGEERPESQIEERARTEPKLEDVGRTDPSTSDDADSSSMPTPPLPSSDTIPSLDEVSARTRLLHRSYLRSSEPLTGEIFTNCARLSSLLQVPVLWTSDGTRAQGRVHEAEAMASALVRAGFADAVASEDSDVILYDVPLVRNLTGVRKGLELVDSRAARECLFPLSSAGKDAHKDMGAAEEVSSSSATPSAKGLTDAASPDARQPAPEAAPEAEFAQAQASEQSGLGQEQTKRNEEEEREKESKSRMLEFALLCGTDFNRTIPGIAAKTALKLLRCVWLFGCFPLLPTRLLQQNW